MINVRVNKVVRNLPNHLKNNQQGIVLPVVFLLVAISAIVIYLVVSSVAPFKDGFLSSLFPKPFSQAAGVVDLALIPDTVTVKQNDNFLVDLVIDSKTEKASCIDFEINYDPQILEATALEPGFFFTETFSPTTIASGKAHKILCQRFDPVTGTDAFKTGTGTVATLAFKALQNTTTASQITINPTTTQIAAIGKTENVVGTLSNSSVTVSPLAVINKNAQFSLTVPAAAQPIGGEFAVQIRASTATDAANLFVSKLSFDPAKLTVTRIDTNGSFISQWVNNNSFDNTNGRIALIGGVPTPGYQTTNPTTMATIYFSGKAAGSAAINFDAASAIYRNSDNQNILGTLTNNSVTISTVVASPSPSVVPSPSVNPSVAPSPSAGASASPVASASPQASPSPVASPSAGNSPAPSASVVASASPVASPSTAPINCTITQAAWVITSNPINEGKVVSLNIKANGTQCTGRSVAVTVWEDDGLLGGDPVEKQPPTVKFDANGNANTSWLAEFQNDGLNGINNPPEYYFLASLDGVNSFRSANPLLVVNPVTSGQGLKGDANRDGKVDFTDLSILLSNWNKTSGFNDELDYNDDGVINSFDFAGLVQLLFLAGLVN